MFYRCCLITFLAGLVHNVLLAAPIVHFGPQPAWVVTMQPGEQQPDLRDVNDGYYIQLFDEQLNVETAETYQHTVRNIVSDAGVQGASNLSINFNPAYEQVTVHHVTVWRDGQPMDKLKKAGFKVIANEQDLAMFIYNGEHTAYLIIDDVRKGDKIDYAYTLRGANPVFNGKFFTSLTFQTTDPISRVHYSIIAPATRKLGFKYFNEAAQPVVTTNGNTIRYEWDQQNVKGREYDNAAPGWFNPFPRVQLSEYKNWGEVIDWAAKINTPTDKLSGSLGKRVQQLKEQYKTDYPAIVRAATDIVQNEVRYMGVELGDYSHKANNPEKVYEQRYGDCKDKSMLLVCMLRSAGVPADMAFVSSILKDKIGDRLPSPSAFNHCIAVAHVSGQDVWIDPTMSYQGGTGTELYCPDYGKAMVLAPGTNYLTDLPDAQGGEIDYIEQYDGSDVKKPVSLTVLTTYSLSKADELRNSFANQSKRDLEKGYLDYYSKIYPHIKVADTLIITDDKRANIIKTVERYTIDDFFEYDSANQYYPISFYAAMIRNVLPVVGNKKEYPIAVTYPYNIHYTINMNAPLNWNVKHRSEVVLRNAYRFSYDISGDKDRLSLQYQFTYWKDHIAPDQIAQYEKDRKKIVNEHLSWSASYNPGVTNTHKGFNYAAIMVFLLVVTASVFAGIRIYKTCTTTNRFTNHRPQPIGGWLFLPLIGLILSVFRLSWLLYSSGYFSASIYHAYDSFSHAFQFKLLLWTELVVNTFILCYSIFCTVLFFRKRDILPKCMMILYIGSVIVVAGDNFAAHAIYSSTKIDQNDIFRSVISAVIWIPYFYRSQRVKDTFIVSYPEATYVARQEEPLVSDAVATEVDATEAPADEQPT